MDKLVSRKNARLQAEKDVDLSGTQLKRWVINRSSRPLSDNETKLLAKGLNFAISPDKIPVEDFILQSEEASISLPPAQRPAFRAEILTVLRNAKPPKSNITREDRQALKSLSKADDVLILPADKGRCTVVLDKAQYTQQVEEMLSDKDTYKTLENDPTSSNKRKLVTMLRKHNKDGKFSQKEY